METVEYKDFSFTFWAVGCQDKFRSMWHHYYQDPNGLIYVVDCNDRDRVEEAKAEVNRMMNEDEMCDVVVLVVSTHSHPRRQLAWESS